MKALIRWLSIIFLGRFTLEEFDVGKTHVVLYLKNGDTLKPIFVYTGYVHSLETPLGIYGRYRIVVRSEGIAKSDIERQSKKGLIGVTQTEYISSTEIRSVEYVTKKFIKTHGI